MQNKPKYAIISAEVIFLFIHCVSNLVIKKVYSANRLSDSPVGITINRTNRECWAIVLKFKGKTVYTVNGKSVISDAHHPVILPKGCNYSWKCYEAGDCILIDFDADASIDYFTSFEIGDNSEILTAFSKIEKNLSAKKQYSHTECIFNLYKIILLLLKSDKKEQSHPKINRILKPAEKYINESYFDSNITNEFLANLCGISTVYFRKSFENVYGAPPIKYLHTFRINKAKAILLSDYETIEQVAISVGYNSIYHFSKMFKKYVGINPSEYAKTSRK